MKEQNISQEVEAKTQWLSELSNFIVEANKNTWASDGAEVDPERPGYKELEYVKGLWRLRDSYTGYFRAPGMTTVYFKDRPSWMMQYAGHGQTEEYYDRAKATYTFLRKALMHVSPSLPIRGPESFTDGDYEYTFKMLEGNLEDGLWKEEVRESGIITFRQTGMVGLIINKDSSKNPTLPWNF